ncbi:porin [Bosea sp. 117]|uniref:porin n=1 Tax=Bosea sp. 117 TaxID=1125973 RepID=UPI0012DF5275|nr:porin [Bosea sp. 117]
MQRKFRGVTGVGCLGAAIGALLLAASGPAAAQVNKDIGMNSSTQDRACAAYGPGFVRSPGSSTCIKVGGYARSDAYTQKYGFTGAGSNTWGSSLRSQ